MFARPLLALACLGGVGCAGPYRGAVQAEPSVRTEECLDVAVRIAPPEPEQPATTSLLYIFGNRCDRPLRLDFGGELHVVSTDGRRDRLAPDGGAHSATLDAFSRGAERIAYGVPRSSIAALCVDPSRLASDRALRPVCMRATDGGDFAYVDSDTIETAVDPSRAPGASATIEVVSRRTDPETGVECVAGGSPSAPSWCSELGYGWQRGAPLVVGFGLSEHHLGLRDRTMRGGFSYGVANALPADPLGAIEGVTVDIDIFGYVVGPIYLGVELQVGGMGVTKRATFGPDFVVGRGGALAGAGGVAGLAFPRIGPFELRAEAFAGGWVAWPTVISPSAPTVQSDDEEDGGGVSIAGAAIEARARSDVWLTPWLTIGAWAGLDALHEGDRSFGLLFATHARSFDGTW